MLKRKPLELVVLQGGGRGARHSLTAPHLVLGRLDPYETASFGNLLFPEPTVSRVHATLDWDEAANRYLLTHRSATNPTIINKAKVSKPRHVSPGDKIQMGNLILEIRVGIGQHAEVELATVDFTALTKQAANQVYRPESVMPEPPAVPVVTPQPPQEAPIPDPIPPPVRRQLPEPVFHEPYAPVEVVTATHKASVPFLEFPEPDEQVPVVREAPRRIQLSNPPRQDDPKDGNPTSAPALLPLKSEASRAEEWEEQEKPAVALKLKEPLLVSLELSHCEASDLEVEGSGSGVASVTCGDEDLDAVGPSGELIPGQAAELEVLSESPGVEGVPGEAGASAAPPEAEAETAKTKPFRRDARKVGRNEKCPCGSGKKYKKCCGK